MEQAELDAYKSLIHDMRKALGNALDNFRLIQSGKQSASLYNVAQTENDLKAFDERIRELMEVCDD